MAKRRSLEELMNAAAGSDTDLDAFLQDTAETPELDPLEQIKEAEARAKALEAAKARAASENAEIEAERQAHQDAPAVQTSVPDFERKKVDLTVGDHLNLNAAALSDFGEALGNRLGRRQLPPSGAGSNLRKQVYAGLAGRQNQANLEHTDQVNEFIKAQAEVRAQEESKRQKDLNDPNSRASQRAWEVTQQLRKEAGLPVIADDNRQYFTAGNAEQWLANRPEYVAGKVAKEREAESAQRAAEGQASEAQEMLAVARQVGIPGADQVDTTNPKAVKVFLDKAMQDDRNRAALQRAQTMAAAQRRGQELSANVKAAMQGFPDDKALADNPRLANDAANRARQLLADPEVHKTPGVADAIQSSLKHAEARARTLPGHRQVANRPPPSDDEYKKAIETQNAANAFRLAMEKVASVAPTGLSDIADPKKRAAAQAAINHAIVSYSHANALGALDNGSILIGGKAIGGPDDFLNILTGNGPSSVLDAMDNILAPTEPKILSFGFEPLDFSQQNTDQLRELYQKGDRSPELIQELKVRAAQAREGQ